MPAVHSAFSTRDPGAAEDHLRRMISDSRIRSAPREGFAFSQSLDGDADLNVSRFRIAGASTTTSDDPGMVFATRRRAGSSMFTANGVTDENAFAKLILPGAGAVHTAEDVDLEALVLSTALVEQVASRLYNATRALPTGGMRDPVSPTLEAHWVRTLDFLTESFFRNDDAFNNALIRATTQESCAMTVLSVFLPPPDGSPADGELALPSSVRRAVDFIEEHALDPITIADIAEAARLSVRGVQVAMRRHLGETPTERLRNERLERARAILLQPPTTTTVAVVARSAGFAHSGRFAIEYRRRFGESPSVTLRAAGGSDSARSKPPS